MILKGLFYYDEKVFTLMNIWMIEKKISETLVSEKNIFTGM